jgi:putative cofactor-binding repeat protein
MDFDRRHLLGLGATAASGAAVAAVATPAAGTPAGAPITTLGLDAAHFGLRAGSSEDQSRALQSAIDAAAKARTPLAIAPGTYASAIARFPAYAATPRPTSRSTATASATLARSRSIRNSASKGAIISNNSVDGAAIGVSVTNFNEGGRLASVQGNIVRNLKPQRPAGTDPGDAAGIGIAVEADSAVAGNVIESAPLAGIMLGYGRYLRDVAATGNVVRKADIGIGVSVASGAAATLVANNLITGFARGAIVGMAGAKAVTGDLAQGAHESYAHLTLSGNRIR